MAGLQHARIGASLEVASASLAGHRFEKHSHDEFVISANLCGLEDVWLDGRTFQADSGDLTLYNPGQIQGGGVRDGLRRVYSPRSASPARPSRSTPQPA